MIGSLRFVLDLLDYSRMLDSLKFSLWSARMAVDFNRKSILPCGSLSERSN